MAIANLSLHKSHLKLNLELLNMCLGKLIKKCVGRNLINKANSSNCFNIECGYQPIHVWSDSKKR